MTQGFKGLIVMSPMIILIIWLIQGCEKNQTECYSLITATSAQTQFIHIQEYFDKEVSLCIGDGFIEHSSEYDNSYYRLEIQDYYHRYDTNKVDTIDVVIFPQTVNVGDLEIKANYPYWLTGTHLVSIIGDYQQFVYQ